METHADRPPWSERTSSYRRACAALYSRIFNGLL